MCFYIHNKHKKVKIAEKNITCYKRLENHSPKYFRSPIQKYKYEKGSLYYEDSLGLRRGFPVIEVGIHSYSTLEEARDNWTDYGYKIVKCTIPKGSKYYYNPDYSEYVSDHLKIGNTKDIIK